MERTYPGKICASIAAQTVDQAITMALAAVTEADVIEIRLDLLEKPSVPPFVAAIHKPLLFTNRASWEGGHCSDDEEKRVDLLHEAVDAKAAYLDIEVKTEDRYKTALIQHAKEQGCTPIVSWHSFSNTPSRAALLSILQEQYRSGADVGKIVTTAHTFADVLRVLNLQNEAQEMGFSLIAFCMGKAGVISRVATLGLGGYMTYAAAHQEAETAPGQLALKQLNGILEGIYHAG